MDIKILHYKCPKIYICGLKDFLSVLMNYWNYEILKSKLQKNLVF